MNILRWIIFAVVVSYSTSPAQISVSINAADLHAGKIGLGVDGLTGSPDLLLKYFFNNQLAMQLIVGAAFDLPGGTAPSGLTKVNGVTLRGGISILYHLSQDPLTPYIGAEGIFQRATSGGFFVTEPDAKNTIVARVIIGGEYFLFARFSLGIKQSIGAEIRLSRSFPKEETQTILGTATAFTGRYYFN